MQRFSPGKLCFVEEERHPVSSELVLVSNENDHPVLDPLHGGAVDPFPSLGVYLLDVR